MAIPLLLLSIAFAAAWMMAYGTSSSWGSWGAHGVSFILWSRQLQWLLIAVSVIFSLGLIAMVAAGRRRVWWLIGLLPMVMLFGHRFVTGREIERPAANDPPLVTADKAGFVLPDDHVIGLVWNNTAYAFPYSAMFHTRAVVLNDRTGPLVLIWSPYANRALAVAGARELLGHDLEVVSSPDDAVIVYNTRLGQFINGVTGLTPQGTVPTGFGSELQTWKTTWVDWKTRHPQTQVMAPYETTLAPSSAGPIQPEPLPQSSGLVAGVRHVCVVATTQPLAVPTEAITDKPLNLTAGETPVLLVRVNGVVRAFERRMQIDLRPRFFPATKLKLPSVVWSDDDDAFWTAAGEAVDGPAGIKGTRLVPIRVEDDLDWGIEKFWLPNLKLATPDELKAAIATPETKPATNKNGDPLKPKKKKPKPATK